MNTFRHRHHFAIAALILVALASPVRAGELTLALANSTCDAMKRVGDLYRASHPGGFTYICKSSGLLAKGLRGGALKADLFVSADREWMDYAIGHGLVNADTVSSPWGNALVVAAPRTSPLQRIDWQDLASDQVRVILIGDPSTAPFGRHAKEALESSGLWDRVKHKIQTRKNIELVAASLAASGPDTVGIMFKSNLTDQLRSLHAIDRTLHNPIRYHMAPLTAAAGNAALAPFVKFMHSPAVRDIFQAEGFDVSPP
jgi:molybdate transport system substrate-binding protein